MGNRPENSPLDSHSFSDNKRAMWMNVAWRTHERSTVAKTLPARKFMMGTPDQVRSTMQRTWDAPMSECLPTSEKIVKYISKLPETWQKIVDNDGTVVKEIDNRKGRRATRKFVPHSDCNENIAKRKRKYDEYEAADLQAGRN